ncbi:unnamed protein product [Parnassius apollo]|uniref:(apollo) hypothetical protein n=1 Tax=Parnassius apollo TaxID=110799 RepID=A0A8S3XGY9_PARAO|nr:unnamed protein product [Parnassius apollo]
MYNKVSSASQLRSMSREEEIELCVQQIISDDSCKITIELEEQTVNQFEKEKSKNFENIVDKEMPGTSKGKLERMKAPSQWPTICALARKVPKPYEVEVLSHKNFEGWDTILDRYFKGNLAGKISRIRTATLKKADPHHIEVKYSMKVEAKSEKIEIIGKGELIPKLNYKSKLPISKKKYSDLEKLCNNKTIPAMYVAEYKSLPHAVNVQDFLADTDIEDIQD